MFRFSRAPPQVFSDAADAAAKLTADGAATDLVFADAAAAAPMLAAAAAAAGGGMGGRAAVPVIGVAAGGGEDVGLVAAVVVKPLDRAKVRERESLSWRY